MDVIPASRSVDGNNRILLSYTNSDVNFTQAQFLGNGTNLNGVYFRTDVQNALMLRSIIKKKAVTSSVVTAEANRSYIRLETLTIDAIQSQLAGQVDIAMPWRAINIVSPDLLHEPERSQEANSELPILSSYTLQAQFDPSVDDQGDITGFTSTPHGDMQFSEGGLRRYHSLVKVPGGLRTFSLQAQLSPKDPAKPMKRILCHPVGPSIVFSANINTIVNMIRSAVAQQIAAKEAELKSASTRRQGQLRKEIEALRTKAQRSKRIDPYSSAKTSAKAKTMRLCGRPQRGVSSVL